MQIQIKKKTFDPATTPRTQLDPIYKKGYLRGYDDGYDDAMNSQPTATRLDMWIAVDQDTKEVAGSHKNFTRLYKEFPQGFLYVKI